MKSSIAKAAVTTATFFIAALAAAHGGGSGAIVVDSVSPGSPAAAAGLQAGDKLLRFDGQETANREQLETVMAAHQPGDTVPITVERQGEPVDLTLTFGERPGGGVSIGVSLAITTREAGATTADPGGKVTRDECFAWIEETYRVESMLRDLKLDFLEDADTVRACLKANLQQMPSYMPRGWCDNAFKIHCSAVGLLTEIGEALVEQCEELLGEPLGSCAGQKVFDRYALSGEASDEAACRVAQLSCSNSG